jgi:hypothetical protein
MNWKVLKDWKKTKKVWMIGLVMLILVLVLICGIKVVLKNKENKDKVDCQTKSGVKTFLLDTYCGGGKFKYMTFACYDGFGRREGEENVCKPDGVWKIMAENYCEGHSGCSVTPVKK